MLFLFRLDLAVKGMIFWLSFAFMSVRQAQDVFIVLPVF